MGKNDFSSTIANGYATKGEHIVLGGAMHEAASVDNLSVTVPLKTMNRHGLVAGATGTGKTKTLQRLAESLSEKSIPVLLMDIKGDLSGLSQAGSTNSKIEERVSHIGNTWKATGYPVEFLSLSGSPGVPLRATVSEFGPVLFSKILELNDTQQSIVSLLFKFADDNGLALLDLKDLRKLIQYVTGEGKKELTASYGAISTASTGLILRKIVEIEQQGADTFFGEPSFDVGDLLRIDDAGRGYIHILRLADIQDKPKLFSTFMLALLSEVYATFPEEGDSDQPKLVIMIDEAHLVFEEATKTLLDQMETVIKLIRSKGVGVIFCTQLPTDVPPAILSQLGMKIQHSLRAFTAADRKAIKLVSENYPETEFYDTESLLTSLGIGEALVTVLDEKGNPTPLVQTLMAPPQSRMDTITDSELNMVVTRSTILNKYSQLVDRESAYELLVKKLQPVVVQNQQQGSPSGDVVSDVLQGVAKSSFTKSIGRSIVTSVVRNVTGQITRGLLGAILGKGVTTKRGRSLF